MVARECEVCGRLLPTGCSERVTVDHTAGSNTYCRTCWTLIKEYGLPAAAANSAREDPAQAAASHALEVLGS